jgi:predicted secreted protein
MKFSVKAIMAVLSVLFAGSAWYAAFACDQGADKGRTVTVGKAQSGQKLRVRPGDMNRVELPASGGNGYAWYLDNLNSEYLELVSEQTKQESEGGKIGAPVTAVWLFQAKKEGWSEIRLNYFRKWEGKEKSADHFIVKVRVIGSEK